jgi:hypothetical protein
MVKIVILSRIRAADPDRIVKLAEFGHLGMQVHRGTKLFDLKRFEVTKVFDNAVSREDAEAEIAASKAASGIKAAPRFLMTDSNAVWFKEEYVCGTHATDLVTAESSDFLEFYPGVESCLLELAGSSAPVKVKMKDYVKQVSDEPFAERWQVAGIETDDIAAISDFLQALRKWLLKKAGRKDLTLVMTHGDFSLVNALLSDDEFRVIDWDGIAPRSALGDVFNFVLAELFYARTSGDFVAEAQLLFERYRNAFIDHHSAMEDAVSLDNPIALRIYYLERLRLMLDRDVTPNINRVVQKSITMFRQFDEDLDLSPL